MLLAGPSRTVRGPVRAQRWIEIGGVGTGALTGAPIEHEKTRVYARLPEGARDATGMPPSGWCASRQPSAASGSRSMVRTWRLRPASVRTAAAGTTDPPSFSMIATSPA